ncbi:hypothetical protein ACFYNO_25085 [Kitasatospora sp. NPDC006697]|uniref:hypothetical protein n=1 Tax=Kitasatospora sp. NPDC006697 TaxID=3364020 RepID=UPI00368D7DD7
MTTLPLAGAKLWQAVTTRAGMRCQCSGVCGKDHAKDGGRCPHLHDGYHSRHGAGSHRIRLMVAPAQPADLLLAPHKAAALPTRELAAWCPDCHHAALSAARKAARTSTPAVEPDPLFTL